MEVRRLPEWVKTDYDLELYHHGIKGQSWGKRRFQNENGTLTEAGKRRYGKVNNIEWRQGIDGSWRGEAHTDKGTSITVGGWDGNKELRDYNGDMHPNTDQYIKFLETDSDSQLKYITEPTNPIVNKNEKGYNVQYINGKQVSKKFQNNVYSSTQYTNQQNDKEFDDLESHSTMNGSVADRYSIKQKGQQRSWKPSKKVVSNKKTVTNGKNYAHKSGIFKRLIDTGTKFHKTVTNYLKKKGILK